MSGWIGGVYTLKGLSLLAKLTQGSSLKITRAVLGTGYVAPEQLDKQTAVTGIMQELELGRATYPQRGECKLPVFMTNEGLTTGYTAKQIGLYANDPDEGEILFFITQSENGTDILTEADMPGYSATWFIKFKYGQAENVDITVDPSNTVTPEELKEVEKLATRGVSSNENGTVIVIEDSAELPFTGLSVMGKSTQNGTPTPTAPVDIESLGADGDINVRVFGKNLVNDVLNGQNSAEYANALSCGIDELLPDTEYTISFVGATGHKIYVNEVLFAYKYILCDGTRQSVAVKTKANISKDNVDQYSGGRWIILKNSEGNTVQPNFTKVQIELGNTCTEYEEHKTAQNITLSTPNGLKGIPVDSGGNYTDSNGQEWICDEIDLVRGVYIQRVKQFECNGIDGGCYTGSHENGQNYVGIYPNDMMPSSPLLCNRYKATPWSSQNNEMYSVDNAIVILDSRFTDVDTTKTILGEELPVVIYSFATPIEIPLSASELEVCKALTANNPTTTILTDSNAEISVDYIRKEHEIGLGSVYQEIEKSVFNKATTTTAPLTYYVNSVSGSDNNDGLTANTAFKTIQHAIDSVPKILVHAATIQVAPGTYDEKLDIYGFTGHNLILTSADGTLDAADNYVINAGINIYYSTHVKLFGFTINHITDVNNGRAAGVYTSSNSVSDVNNCKVYGNKDGFGIMAGYGSKCYVRECHIANHNVGVGGQVLGDTCVYNITGDNNNTGAYARQGGAIRLWTDLPSGFATTMFSTGTGGIITNVDGDHV